MNLEAHRRRESLENTMADQYTNDRQPGAVPSSMPSAPPHGSIYERAFNPGYFYNFGNVFSGVNYGSVVMSSDNSKGEFMLNLPNRLKVSLKAEYMYYPEGNETALRRSLCTPGTRVLIIERIRCWVTNTSPDSECVYWLSGQAGAGKTTIAYTIARQFEVLVSHENCRVILGGSFFCSRQFPETRSASAIIRTIVYHLALRSRPFQMALKEHGRFETVNHGPKSQLMGLLVEPWKMSAQKRLAENEPCYIIPIDALDELDAEGGSELLGTLFEVLEQHYLPGLKFFVTSRSHPALVRRINAFPHKQFCRLEEVSLEESSADIELYLRDTLAECANEHQILQLVSDAAGLFIYAATVVEYLKGRDVGEQQSLLKRLLVLPSSARRPSLGATATLDNLYLQILETSLVDPRDRHDPDVFQDCLSILHTFLCTIERTSTTVALGILNASSNASDMILDAGIADGILRRLHAVLYIQGGQVMWFHKSFSDFLFDKRRSQRFFCHQEQHQRRLADGCFGVMTEQLRFNIADIPSSYRLDCDDEALKIRVGTNVPKVLRYACASWSAHLALVSWEASDHFGEKVNEFLRLRVLFWMEAMNLLGQRGRCRGMLGDARRWFSKSKRLVELVNKLCDAGALATYHSASKAALSTPHLYISSLATFPRHSAVVRAWRGQLGGIPKFIGATEAAGEALVSSISVGMRVNALAVSPDDTNVAAVGFNSSDVQIWDLSTGTRVMTLRGHTDIVNVVAYAPDGTRVASGSRDQTILVWDPSAGEAIKTLKGHSGGVTAVAYSTDGIHVISGSVDGSVRMWNLSFGEEVRILLGHSGRVNAVAYSSQCNHVVSGGDNGSVRIWDLSTGGVKDLEGCGDSSVVNAVAFSSDAAHVVAGGVDGSVRVWDLPVGAGKILKRHGNTRSSIMTTAVAYSLDTNHVVSGAADGLVCVWDPSGEKVRKFNGHTGRVNAVAYSEDHSHIISGSNDQSIRVWDLSAKDKTGIFRGHTQGINAVAYSPSATHLVSGADDGSVRVWDLSTGEDVKYRDQVSDSEVTAVACSPCGTRFVCGRYRGSVAVWELSTGECVKNLVGHTQTVRAVAYSPSGTHIVSGSDDKSVRVWSLSGEEVKIFKGHTSWVRAVAYSPDGAHVASASDDKSVQIWDPSTAEKVQTLNGHTDGVCSVAYSPDGTHIVSGSFDHSVRVWNLSTGEEVLILKGHNSRVRTVAYSPDGTQVASGANDRTVRVWNTSTGQEVRTFRGHTSEVNGVAYSPDGTHIASVSRDKSVRVWDLSPGHDKRYAREKDGDSYTGWLLSPTDPSLHLMFVPPEALLPDDANVKTFPASAVPHLDFSKATLGDRWAECYTPTSL